MMLLPSFETLLYWKTGGQQVVPEDWIYKVAQTINLLIDPYFDNVAAATQAREVKILSGDLATSHARLSTDQRIASGEDDYYSPNPLESPES